MEEHFSHQHVLLALQLEEGDKVGQCHGCEEQISDPILIHGCLSCDFYLHDSCANAPRFLNHPSHPLHPLTLLPTPTYTSRSYGCDACGSNGKAFSYSCARCEFDLHLKCASMPKTIVVKAHKHELELVFDSSYRQKDCLFMCDLCEGIVNSGNWIYYCKACDFGTHLGCIAWKGFLEKGLWEMKGKHEGAATSMLKDIPRTSKGGNGKDSWEAKDKNYAKSKVGGKGKSLINDWKDELKDIPRTSKGGNGKYLNKGKDENEEKSKVVKEGKSSNGGNVELEDPNQEQDLQKEISKAQAKMEDLRQDLDLVLRRYLRLREENDREQTIAHQMVPDALDNAADYVGPPPYTRRYY